MTRLKISNDLMINLMTYEERYKDDFIGEVSEVNCKGTKKSIVF